MTSQTNYDVITESRATVAQGHQSLQMAGRLRGPDVPNLQGPKVPHPTTGAAPKVHHHQVN